MSDKHTHDADETVDNRQEVAENVLDDLKNEDAGPLDQVEHGEAPAENPRHHGSAQGGSVNDAEEPPTDAESQDFEKKR